MASWHEGKEFLEYLVGINHDALHVLVGMLAWLFFALIVRRPISSIVPWAMIFVLTLWNEGVDLWVEKWPEPGRQYGEGAKDLLLTMFVPTVLMLAARYRPDLFRQGFRRARSRRR